MSPCCIRNLFALMGVKRSAARGARDDAPTSPMPVACPQPENVTWGHSGPEPAHPGSLSTLAATAPLRRRLHPPPTYQLNLLKPLNYFSHFSGFSGACRGGQGLGAWRPNFTKKRTTLNPLNQLKPLNYFSQFSHFSWCRGGKILGVWRPNFSKTRPSAPAKTAKLF